MFSIRHTLDCSWGPTIRVGHAISSEEIISMCVARCSPMQACTRTVSWVRKTTLCFFPLDLWGDKNTHVNPLSVHFNGIQGLHWFVCFYQHYNFILGTKLWHEEHNSGSEWNRNVFWLLYWSHHFTYWFHKWSFTMCFCCGDSICFCFL